MIKVFIHLLQAFDPTFSRLDKSETDSGCHLQDSEELLSLLPPLSGKVLACTHIKSQDKCALKILKDTAKSRREVDLHWRASGCRHIVNIRDVYENTHNKEKCLMVVMEWSVSGSWMCEAFTSLN